MAVQLASRPKPLLCPRIPPDPVVTMPESMSLSPFATPGGSPSGSPAHSRTNSSQDVLNLLTGGIGAGVHGPAGSGHASTHGSAHGSARSSVQGAGTQQASAAAQGSANRPFLHSLLSASPFASLFQAPTPSPLAQHEPLPRTHSSGDLPARSANQGPGAGRPRSGSPDPVARVAHSVDGSSQPRSRPASVRQVPESILSDSEDDDNHRSSVELSSRTDRSASPAARSGGQELPEQPGERSRSLMDLPSLLSATVTLGHRAFWDRATADKAVTTASGASSIVDFGTSDSPMPGLEEAAKQCDIADSVAEDEPQISLVRLTFQLLELAVETYLSTGTAAAPSSGSVSSTFSPLLSQDGPPAHVSQIGDQGLGGGTTSAHAPLVQRGASPDPYSFAPRAYGVAGDPTFLLNTLRTVFSSAESLAESFLAERDLEINDSHLDIPSIRKSYHLILQLKPPDLFQNVLANALELLLAKMLLNRQKLRHAGHDMLRVIVIVMENPLLLDPIHHESLLRKLCLVMACIKSRSKLVLIKWFSQYDTAGFEKIVRIFQQYIFEHVHQSGSKPDESIIGATKTLSMLTHANEAASVPITPFTTFHMPSLAQKINFKEEYRVWRRTLESQRISDFSFFNYPFMFDPVAKTRIMHIDARVQMSHEFEGAYVQQAVMQHAQRMLQDSPSAAAMEQELKRVTNPFLVLDVRRNRLVDDVLDQILRKEADLKKPLKVRFVGGGEEGQDQGGVQKEFFQILVAQLLDPGYGMFVYDEETRSSWINGASLEPERQFELVGVIIGLALYNGVMLGLRFPQLLYKKLLDARTTFADFKDAFPTLGRGLQQLLDWSDGDVADVFLRSFEISYEIFGQVKTYPLVDDGENITVTNENRAEYVRLYVQHYTGEFIKRQFKAFRRGFHKVVGGQALKMCRPEELELLICGNTTTEIDFGELQRTAEYDGFDETTPIVVWFWEIVHAMDLEHKKQLLNFVTASDRVPLNGFANLTFVIQRNGPDTDRLPTALTCFGRLLLPEYTSKEKLENRLMTAIENAKGFGLI
nr:hypothetical protein HK105_004575 [Polyrhizophydium stewartii]